MIIDAFMFYNEFELLKMRLIELESVVDKFVLVQGDRTFRGDINPNRIGAGTFDWLKQYENKLVVVDIIIPSWMNKTWDRERHQRNAISTYVKTNFDPGDIVIISDVDEIPRREIVAGLCDLTGPVALNMAHFNYGLNCLFPGPWFAAKALPVRDVTTAEEIRKATFSIIEDAGWHFSYLGDDEFISNKFRSFSHSEVDTPEVHSRIAENRAKLLDPHNHGQQLEVVEVTDRWPHAVRDDPYYWSKYIWIN